MAITREDMAEILRYMTEDRDVRREIQRTFVIGEIETRLEPLIAAQNRLEQAVSALAEAQARTEERLERVEAAVQRLAEAQARTEERLEALAEAQARTEERLQRLEATVEHLAEAQARTEKRLDALAEAQARTEERLQSLAEHMARLTDVVADLKGRALEVDYARKAPAVFGRLLRRVRVVEPVSMEEQLEEQLSPDELADLYALDVLLSGVSREGPRAQLWVAMEVSSIVDRRDVERSVRRCRLLSKAGLDCLPAVAGEGATEGARALAQEERAVLVQDGRLEGWEQAVGHWL